MDEIIRRILERYERLLKSITLYDLINPRQQIRQNCEAIETYADGSSIYILIPGSAVVDMEHRRILARTACGEVAIPIPAVSKSVSVESKTNLSVVKITV